MRVLITGADGFAGQHLLRELMSAGSADLEIHGTAFRPIADTTIPYHILDLRDERAVTDLIVETDPEQIYHLAGTASVGQSYSEAWNTLENNIRAQLNLTLACLKFRIKVRLLVVSSGDIYGDKLTDAPANEDTPLRPANPYAVSKVTQDMLALQYHLSHDLATLRARPFNHLGPGQSRGFVAPDFGWQIASIEAGQQDAVLQVGSLSAERDFTDVRDVVRAYRLIMERGVPGEAYNIASGKTCTMRSLLDAMLAHSSIRPIVRTDTARLRPGVVSKVWGDSAKLRTATGWQPVIPFEQTLFDVLQDCRQRVQALSEEPK